MRYMLFVLVMLAGRSSALNPPAADRKDAIQLTLNSALSVQKEIDQIQAQIDDKRNGPSVIRALIAEKRVQERKRDLAYNLALRQTMLAYGLVEADAEFKPIMPRGKTVYPDFNGRQAAWVVVYKENEVRTVLKNSGGRDNVAPGGGTSGGVTYADGVTTIYGRFENPDDVALLLRHEQLHFEQLTTKGIGDKLTKNECELDVRNTLLNEVGGFGFTPEGTIAAREKLNREIRILRAAIAEEKSLVSKVRRMGKSPEPLVLEAHSSNEYAALVAAAGDFDSQVGEAERVLVAKAKEDKEKAELRAVVEKMMRDGENAQPAPLNVSRPGEDPPGYVRIVPAQPGSGPIAIRPGSGEVGIAEIAHIYGIASRACVPNAAVTEQDVASVDWAALQKAKNVERNIGGLSPCEQRVFLKLVEFGRAWTPGATIGADAVRAAAAEPVSYPQPGGGSVPPTQSHDPVWKRVNPIIRHR